MALAVLGDRLLFDTVLTLYFSHRRRKAIVGQTILISNILFYTFKPT